MTLSPNTALPVPDETEAKSVSLGRLALHCPPRKMPDHQFRLLIQDYLSDLAPYSAAQVDAACVAWRRSGDKFYPAVSDLIRSINGDTAARAKPPERRPFEASGRWVAMTGEARAKIQDGMNRAAELQPGPVRERLLELGDVLLRSNRVWRKNNA